LQRLLLPPLLQPDCCQCCAPEAHYTSTFDPHWSCLASLCPRPASPLQPLSRFASTSTPHIRLCLQWPPIPHPQTPLTGDKPIQSCKSEELYEPRIEDCKLHTRKSRKGHKTSNPQSLLALWSYRESRIFGRVESLQGRVLHGDMWREFEWSGLACLLDRRIKHAIYRALDGHFRNTNTK
jgi:hypothetical protein